MEKYQKRLSKHIMEVALYLQSCRQYILDQNPFYEGLNWVDFVNEKFYTQEFKTKIVKSEGNLRRLLNMQITEEIMRTPFKSLSKYKIEGIGIRVK